MNDNDIYIVAARRTPLGAFQGTLADASAIELSAAASRAALTDAGIDGDAIDEALIGCVLPAGLGQAPARQAILAAGVPQGVPATTINKVCGSGMKTVMLGHDLITAGAAGIVLAGGMESMTNAPYLMPGARGGYRMGHREVFDHMFYDGLQSPFDGQMMGHFGEETAQRYGFSREAQDAFAVESVTRAKTAAAEGRFDGEIAAVTVKGRKGETTVESDEIPPKVDVGRIPDLKPAFAKDGTVTAASSSSIADGAASLILASAEQVKARGLAPLARIVAHSGYAHEPAWFTTAPIFAVKSLLEKTGCAADDVDLYEINEAFAVVTMAAMQDLDIGHERVNVLGGACALGHPIGASGARIIVTLVNAMRQREARRGIASLCLGGGEAVAVLVEAC
ncbi:MAG: acetyl-CoA C-acyltransferase [Woeseiaceae bacterium]|nr:acetyl-CoA C-acyltransferase [Woeseiaceae bacterium]